ncbi:ExeM/NucH family extracellular endonuclease [Halioxenophilus sp. WMMB6]|uniref:ExeM/NucH family extracellular endonuclease n=1 Tax=Halioxenophilus sp. WMMB6 TaxID=3073815 RepID=UPI00295ED8C5|nr:ExeM/NucH family extracellular endonuclease [Halioxenophilus sp. WMMB6]
MKNWLLTVPLLAASVAVNADMMLTAVYDGPLTGGVPKGVEIYVTADIPDLSIYGIGSANNGGGSDGEELTFSGSASAGSYIYVATESAGFETFFGFSPDLIFVGNAASINGDDAIELFKNGEVIDVYGDINVDGTGQVWDHLDGWAYRNSYTAPNLGSFVAGEWTYSGTNVWDNEVSNLSAASMMPIGTFTTDFTTIGDGPVEPPPPAVELGACFEEATLISTVQGSGSAVAVAGAVVVEGIVTAFNEGGFFLQEEPSDSDADSTTSEGIFIFSLATDSVAVGDLVRVLGDTTEYFGNSEIAAQSLLNCGLAGESISPVTIPMPYAGILDLESVEGMVAAVTDATIFTLDNFTRYGEIMLSDGLKWSPTDVAVPLSAEYDAAVANASANILLLADDNSQSYPATISYYTTPGFDGLNYSNAPRVGDKVSASGPVLYSFSNYRIIPTKESFAITSSRTPAPVVVEGDVKVASFNVLNYFNGLRQEDGTVTFDYPANRGAESAEAFALQQARIVAALLALDADVVGLLEIENDGFGSDSAIKQLVSELNTALGKKVYRFAHSPDTSITGSDAISNAVIYKKDAVSAMGLLQAVPMPVQDNNGSTVAMRNTLVQSFVHKATGDKFAVAVNHFKSKGSGCYEDSNSPTALDTIQGSCNALRVSAAVTLGNGLAAMNLPAKVLILGDLNSYSMEDPVAVLTDYSPEQRGYTITTAHNTNLDGGLSVPVSKGFGYLPVKELFDADGFSYFFYGTDQVGSLDHILASPEAMASVVDLSHWNINSVELYQLEYHQALSYYNGAEGDLIDFTAVGPYRSSDHDPVVVTLEMQHCEGQTE